MLLLAALNNIHNIWIFQIENLLNLKTMSRDDKCWLFSSDRSDANFCLNTLGFAVFKTEQELSPQYRMN